MKKKAKKVIKEIGKYIAKPFKNLFNAITGTIQDIIDGDGTNSSSNNGGGSANKKPSKKKVSPKAKCPEKDPSIYSSVDGFYGGNQNGPYLMWQDGTANQRNTLRTIVKKYKPYKQLSDREIGDLFIRLNKEGCSYVASVNTIFISYINKEKEFKNKFGFDMYRKIGGTRVCNFEFLITDLYCATDNHNNGFWPWEGDKITDKEPGGANANQQKYRLELYAKLKGFNVDVSLDEGWFIFRSEIPATVENYEKYKSKGQIGINMFKYNLYYSVGGKNPYHSDGGHAMIVTGIIRDNWISVSSWGSKYYVNLDDKSIGSMYFMVFSYD